MFRNQCIEIYCFSYLSWRRAIAERLQKLKSPAALRQVVVQLPQGQLFEPPTQGLNASIPAWQHLAVAADGGHKSFHHRFLIVHAI